MSSKFFSKSKMWLRTPFHMAQHQLEEQSARDLLPKFTSHPPWDPDRCGELLHKVLPPKTGFAASPPSWDRFQQVMEQPQKKAGGPDQVAPHLLSWLSWDL